MAGREDLAPKGLDILTRDVSLDEIQSLFDITTGHDHDGTNSAIVSWNNIADKPSGLYYSLTAPTNEFTSSDDGVGNLTLSWKTQSAGLVLASPTASSGTPSFRSLIISDIPTITLAKLDNIASGSILGRKTALTGEVEALTITDIKTMLDVINYGVCTTDGATVNKTVDITNFALSLGTKVTVKFDNANSVSNPTLNVSSTGAKAIYNGSSAIDPAMLEAGKIYDFVYDGTNYVLISGSGSGGSGVSEPTAKTIIATAGQTEFTYTDLDGWTSDLLGVLVFRSGIYMTPTTDYTLDAVLKTITFVTPCEANEIITVIFNNTVVDIVYNPPAVNLELRNSSKTFTATDSQTDFDISDIYPELLSTCSVYVNGLIKTPTIDYNVITTSGFEKIVLTTGATLGDTVIVNLNTTDTNVYHYLNPLVNANSKVYVATPSQTEFSIAELYNINTVSVAVFRDGIFQLVSVDYTLDDTSGAEKIILSESCVGGETIVIQVNTTNATVDMSAHNHTFNELTDVSYYPNNHDTIVWNSTTSMWEPKPVSDFINSSSKSFTSIVGQVDFDVSDIYPTDYFNFAVFRNGLLQLQGLDYVLDTSAPGSEKVTLTDACVINEIIIVQFNITNTNVIIPDATESTKGIIEIATSAEVLAGTDTTKAVTSDTLNDALVSALDSYAPKNTPIILKTESYTLALTDNYSLNKCLSASDIIITIPLNSNVAFPIGSELIFVRYGTGEVTFTPAVDVTLYSSDSKRTINMQYEFVTLKKMATDEWILLGSLG